MANKMKYSEEQLCEAVKKYSEGHRGKIKATEVALWARENMAMEEVQGYHFMRTKIVRINGSTKEEKRECTKMIEELNQRRSQLFAIENSVILKATTIDDFFSLPLSEQRKEIVMVRENMREMTKANLRLQIENDVVRSERKVIEKKMELLSRQIEKVAKDIARTMRLCKFVSNRLADERCNELCKEIGIEDENIDLQKFEERIHDFEGVTLDFRDSVKRYSIEASRNTLDNLLDEALNEIKECIPAEVNEC